MRRPSAALLALAVAGGTLGLGACSDGPATSEADAEQLAVDVCGTLVTWVDEISTATNTLDDEVQALVDAGSDDVDTAFTGWVDEVEAATDRLGDEVGSLRFPPTARGEELADDLAAAAAEARAEVDEVRADVEAVVAADESIGGRMRTVLVNTEKVLSLAEPEVDDGEDADVLDQALLAEPTCEHVTEP
jgi:hypothetical protein